MHTAIPFIALGCALTGASAASAGQSRRLLWLCLGAMAVLPFFPASLWAPPLAARMIVAFGAMLVTARSIEVMDKGRDYTLGRRLWHVLSIYDTRVIVRAAPSVRLDFLLSAIAYACLSASGFYVASRFAPTLQLPLRYLVRWSGGILFIYCTIDAADRFLVFAHGLFGFQVPRVQLTPIVSRTLGEFWSERWNRAVSGWLREHVFSPVVRSRLVRMSPRRRLLAGFGATFVVSGLMHGYLAMVGVDWRLAALATAFFFVHGALVATEHAVRLSRRPAVATRIWTITIMLLTAPMLVEPTMTLLSG